MAISPKVPTVLVRIGPNSDVSVLQDLGVQVVLLDERTTPDHVVLVPQRDQYEEILHILGKKAVLSAGSDDEVMTAANCLSMLFRHRLIVGALVPDQMLQEIIKAQEAQR